MLLHPQHIQKLLLQIITFISFALRSSMKENLKKKIPVKYVLKMDLLGFVLQFFLHTGNLYISNQTHQVRL